MTNLDIILKSRDITFANKDPYTESYSFSSSYVWMWELDHKEGWAPNNWCFWTLVLNKTLESPLDSKEIKSVNQILKELNPEYSLEGLMLKLKLHYFSYLMGRADSWQRKTEGWGERSDRGWDGWMHHRLNGHEFEQTPGDSEGQGSLVSCSPWGCKELDTTEPLKNNSKTHRGYEARRPLCWGGNTQWRVAQSRVRRASIHGSTSAQGVRAQASEQGVAPDMGSELNSERNTLSWAGWGGM